MPSVPALRFTVPAFTNLQASKSPPPMFSVPALVMGLTSLEPMRISSVPVPVSIVVPAATVIEAPPGSREAATAFWSSPISTRLPLSVVMSAFTAIERPAWSVRSPPSPPGLSTTTAQSTVMSLLACNTRSAPVSSIAVMLPGEMAESASGSLVKVCPSAGSAPSMSIKRSFGSNNTVPPGPASTWPPQASRLAEDNSTNPPASPPAPRALTVGNSTDSTSDQRMISPPRPATSASARSMLPLETNSVSAVASVSSPSLPPRRGPPRRIRPPPDAPLVSTVASCNSTNGAVTSIAPPVDTALRACSSPPDSSTASEARRKIRPPSCTTLLALTVPLLRSKAPAMPTVPASTKTRPRFVTSPGAPVMTMLTPGVPVSTRRSSRPAASRTCPSGADSRPLFSTSGATR